VAALEHYSICLASSNVTHNWQLAHGFSHRMTHTHTKSCFLTDYISLPTLVKDKFRPADLMRRQHAKDLKQPASRF